MGIEHSVGIYLGLLLLACLVGTLTKYLTHVPYTVGLTLVGLVVALSGIGPDISGTDFKELVFFVMLPPLLFQGALHMELNRLLQHIWPIVTFAVVGLLISMFAIGGIFYWGAGIGDLSFLVALLFGAMVTPTDPVSVLAIFKQCNVPVDLKYIVEGESLFNDGVGIVVFVIVLGMIEGSGGEGGFHAVDAVLEFLKVTAGGLLIGTVLGIVAFGVMRRFEDHLLENAMCLVLAYGAFWVAEHFGASGVISTVMAGLMIGNYGKRLSMEQKTRETIDTFFESIDFIINSLLFILIGLELQEVTGAALKANLRPLGVAIVAMLIGRALAVYPLYRVLNLAGTRRPRNWSHVLYWGGLRGSIPIALLLGLSSSSNPMIQQHRPTLLVAGFGVVLFSLVVQGLTMKPLLGRLGIAGEAPPGK
jgi:CPA1 family monovalent cation:H+ antiporter